MIILRADNRELLDNAKYSYLLTNYPSGVDKVKVVNSSIFNANDLILIGTFGTESSEIFKIDSINYGTNEITLMDRAGAPDTLKFAHSESTRFSALPYDQVRFFHTSVPVYVPPVHAPVYPVEPLIDTLHPITPYMDIEASRWYTTINDESYSTGWGFFVWYNSETVIGSKPSNPIPYEGFEYDTAKSVMESFFDGLNNKETAIITKEEAFRYLNEGYSIMRNKLNLINSEYAASLEVPITIYSGDTEARMPNDFGDLITVRLSSGRPGETLEPIKLKDIPNSTTTVQKYFIREGYIGLAPYVTSDTIIYIRYLRKADKINSYDDIIYLPDNGYIALQNYMMMKASLKFKDGNTTGYKALFDEWIKDMLLFANKRDNSPDNFTINRSQNV